MTDQVFCRKCGAPLNYIAPGVTQGKDHYRCPKCGYIHVEEEIVV